MLRIQKVQLQIQRLTQKVQLAVKIQIIIEYFIYIVSNKILTLPLRV